MRTLSHSLALRQASSHPAPPVQSPFRWAVLHNDIQRLIYKRLINDEECELSNLATVCRGWQAALEQHTFSRIRLTPARMAAFDAMTRRNRAHVRYIWFCLELDPYDCSTCTLDHIACVDEQSEAVAVTDTPHCPITASFTTLLSVLSTWTRGGSLTLDISIYSTSDSEHWFPYLTFLPDGSSRQLIGTPREEAILDRVSAGDVLHAWTYGTSPGNQLPTAMLRVFNDVMIEGPFPNDDAECAWWDGLPAAPAVTTVLFRQQNWRRWRPSMLTRLLARFTGLEEIVFEPWRELCFSQQNQMDRGHQIFLDSIPQLSTRLKEIVLFENFNQQFPALEHGFAGSVADSGCHTFRVASLAVSRAAARASRHLEYFAASFLVDARQFFFQLDQAITWDRLRRLVLTSKALTPAPDKPQPDFETVHLNPGAAARRRMARTEPTIENELDIGTMLRAAAAAALQMPQLQKMEIWNGRRRLAALFAYQREGRVGAAALTWRATWRYRLEDSVVEAWRQVGRRHDRWRFDVAEEVLDPAAVWSHADAIQLLGLKDIIRPVSLEQIEMEQKALYLAGVPTVG